MLKFTRFGYKIYMTGANQTTAKFSGIPTERVTLFTYIVAGMLSSLTATIVLGRTMSANSDYGLFNLCSLYDFRGSGQRIARWIWIGHHRFYRHVYLAVLADGI